MDLVEFVCPRGSVEYDDTGLADGNPISYIFDL
jgi:hypothetical protein